MGADCRGKSGHPVVSGLRLVCSSTKRQKTLLRIKANAEVS